MATCYQVARQVKAELRQELENTVHTSKFLRNLILTPKINGRHLNFLTSCVSGREKAPVNNSVSAAE